jgi:hypothetical protein
VRADVRQQFHADWVFLERRVAVLPPVVARHLRELGVYFAFEIAVDAVGIEEGGRHPVSAAFGEDDLQAGVPFEDAGEGHEPEQPPERGERLHLERAERAEAARLDVLTDVEGDRVAALFDGVPERFHRVAVVVHAGRR